MKKKIALLMVCVLMVSTFAACGNTQTSGDGAVPTLTWYIPGTKPADVDLVEEEINKIIEPEIGAKLDFVYTDSGAYDEKLNMMMASKTNFDLCFSGWMNFYDRGLSLLGFLNPNEYLDAAPALKEAIPDYAWESVNVGDGDIYAVPNLQIYAMWQALYITKSYADKYNLDVSAVKSVEDLEPFLKQIAENEPDVYPYTPNLYPWNGVGSMTVIAGNGEIRVKNDDEACLVYKSYETPEYKKGVEVLRDFYNKGYNRKDVESAANDSTSAKQTVVTLGAYKPGAEADIALTDRGEVVAIPLGEPCVTREMAVQTLTAISTTSKNPEKAVKLLEMVNTNNELFRLIVHGIEGRHYEMLESGHIKILNSESYNNHNKGFMFGNQFNSLVVEGKDIDVWEQMAAVNDRAVKSPLLGFGFDSANVMNEIANVSAIISEFAGLNNGTVEPESTLSAYKKKLEEAGIDTIVEEAQKQIDEYLKIKNK